MFEAGERFFHDETKVAAKVMDGEAILINLANGLYYSIGGTGGLVWSLIEKQHSLDDIAEAVTRHFEVEREQALADVRQLVSELATEGLVFQVTQDAPHAALDMVDSPSRLPYEPSRLKRFDDMADMFALDPPLPGLADTK